MTARYDVLGLGCVAIDDLLYVDAYPAADTKVQLRRRERQCGGLTGTALVAAARLGAVCAYAGTLGEDELTEYVLQHFQHEGVDVTHVYRQPGARPIHSTVIVAEAHKTRTILYDLENVCGVQPDWPHADLIRAARVLFVDHFGMEGMIRAARIARQAGIAVVADLESDERPEFAELLSLVDHLIVSDEFACKLTAKREPANAALALWTKERTLVAITCGARGCYYLDNGNCTAPRHQPAFPVQALDTTGCGDVFHGAYVAALVRGLEIPACIRFASAAAALKATKPGGQAGIPRCGVVEDFLKEHQS
jgi:sulfofructose kinase